MTQGVREILEMALQQVSDMHGVSVNDISVTWIDVTTCGQDRRLVDRIEIHARVIRQVPAAQD